MKRRFLASVLALWCAACSKTEQPPQAAQPSPPSSAPESAPTLAGQETEKPAASAMRTDVSEVLVPEPGNDRRITIIRPERFSPDDGSEPVLDGTGVERLPLFPGMKVPRPSATGSTPAALAPSLLSPEATPAEETNHQPPRVTMATPAPAASAPRSPASPAPMISAAGHPITTLNELVLDSIRLIPDGGEYRADARAIELLKTAVTISKGELQVVPDFARPSFCSSATYLVFLISMDRLHRSQRLQLSDTALEALLIHGQPDGEGVWGRWNANGPGTGRLFHELGMGRSFTNPMAARPGDFLKVWWNDEIGKSERGHSVIFLGLERSEKGEIGVRYWSSNKPGGFGQAVAPISTIKRFLFSRLEDPRALSRAAKLPLLDRYLADMLKRASTEEEMLQMCGVNTP